MAAQPEIHVHVHIPGLVDHTAQLNRIEEDMATAVEVLTDVKAAVTDMATDVNAKLDQLVAELGQLSPEAQAIVDDIKAAVAGVDERVGDADGSDTPPVEPPVEEPAPGE